jgi:hypothetical protein
VQVTLEKNGDAVYREAPDDDLPLKFHLTEAETAEVFDLVEKLDYFKHPLESPLKVAFMGTKTFRYENGAEKSEVQFNYSEDLPTRARCRTGLSAWPNRPAPHRLERAAKYDNLGVVQALNLLGSAMSASGWWRWSSSCRSLDRVQERNLHAHGARAAAEIAEAIRKPLP